MDTDTPTDTTPRETLPAASSADTTAKGTPTKDTPTKPPANRGGAPKGNTNGLRTGKRSERFSMRLGSLPPTYRRQERAARELRKELEDATAAVHGGVSLTQAASIASACRWERHALLCLRWIRENVETMDHAQRLAYSREIASASEKRDKCLQALKLDAEDETHLRTTFFSEVARERSVIQQQILDGTPDSTTDTERDS